jgi:[ribosomal protein S5]-alanine N-acetyltransferase
VADVTAAADAPDVTLHPMSLAAAAGLMRGRRVVDGPPWHPAYPLADTLIGVTMLTDSHRAAGWDGEQIPAWWIHQVVADGLVVGDIGFHGPASPDREVEIGYALVEAVHRRGIATRAVDLLLELAWRDGAAVVRAETTADNVPSQRVLIKAGFAVGEDGVFEVRR